MSYAIWDAAVEAGATLTELDRLNNGEFSRAFLAKLVAWYNCRNLIATHTNDAQTKAAKAASKR